MSVHEQQAAGLLSAATCPCCSSPLVWSADEGLCPSCETRYPLVDGIPILLAEPAAVSEVETHKGRQAAYFDRAEAEWEITRPRGAPPFYRALIEEKLRRSVSALRPFVRGATALSVCGGSGMDAEFLARADLRVLMVDISLGAAGRARERSRRFGVEIVPVVADAERLPFGDRSIDVVYVHDGLHHLERPLAGLREMTRVARRAVSVNEPARAAATRLAVQVGLSEVVENAGNRIERLKPEIITAELEAAGFHVVRVERYAMMYRHEPGRLSRLLSRRLALPVAQQALEGFNVVAGRIGNKLTVQAVRI
jgi:SAM-dependent methyltransferase